MIHEVGSGHDMMTSIDAHQLVLIACSYSYLENRLCGSFTQKNCDLQSQSNDST